MRRAGLLKRCAALVAMIGMVAAVVSSLPQHSLSAAGVGYVSLPAPARILDTRSDGTTVDGQFAATGIRPFGSTLELPIAGRADVPADAVAVVLNVTVTEAQGDGFITVFPCGTSQPTASNLNYVAGQTVPNMVIAKIGAAGAVCVFNGGATHLIVDVTGYFPGIDAITPLAAPARLLDTRADGVTVDGLTEGDGIRPAGSVQTLQVTGRAAVPTGAASVVLNVTVDQPHTAGYITVYPCDATLPTASNVNYVAGQTIPNAVVAKLSATGTVCLYTSATTHLVVDIAAYFPNSSVFVPLAAPARLLDSRSDGTTVDGQFQHTGVRPTSGTMQLSVTGRAAIPAGASAVVLNVTVDQPAIAGFVTVYPAGVARPNASNLNYVAGQTVPNVVIARLGAGGTVCLFTSGQTHLIVDVAGYLTGPAPAAAAPCAEVDSEPPPPSSSSPNTTTSSSSTTTTALPPDPPSVTDWPGYLHGPQHSSTSFGDEAITPTNVASLDDLWTFVAGPATQPGAPGPKFDASPTVVGNRVFIGSRTGIFYALNANTGGVVWEKQLDFGSAALCPAKGIIGTAAVVPDPVTGALTVYAPGAHYLYALDAVTGAQKWKVAIGPDTQDGADRWYNYSSPTVVGGKVYMGLASNCDAIKIRGGVMKIDQATGQVEGTYYAVPEDQVGLSVWTSVAGDGTSVWVTTGNAGIGATDFYDAFSIVRLSAATMVKQEKWTAPIPITADLDMGGSPTFFRGSVGGTVTDLIGACNKNGIYYAWRRNDLTAGPVWERQVGNPGGTGNGACITAAAFDGPSATLYVAANQTTINGVAVQGSIRALNPSTGLPLWEQPLPCLPNGSPTLNATTHVVAVPLYNCIAPAGPGVALFNATTGAPLRTIATTGKVFAQPVFANGKLFIADNSGRLTAYGP